MRWLGALLMVAACGGMGFAWTGALRRKLALLERLCSLLRRLQTELSQRGTPLPQLAEQLGLAAPAEQLRSGRTALSVAAPYLERLEKNWDLSETARTLEELARVLGRYDGGTQAAACGHAIGQLEVQRDALARELQEKGKLYHTVPLALGLMAALVVL